MSLGSEKVWRWLEIIQLKGPLQIWEEFCTIGTTEKAELLPGRYRGCRDSSALLKSISSLYPVSLPDLLFFPAEPPCTQTPLFMDSQSSVAAHSTLRADSQRQNKAMCLMFLAEMHSHGGSAPLKTLLSQLALRNCPVAFLGDCFFHYRKRETYLRVKKSFFSTR